MNKEIYLDNNATTKCDCEVLDKMLPYLKDNYGNPSSIYSFSKNVKEDIAEARKNVASLLNANANEIIFTSCASESNVSAIMSAVNNNITKRHIITTKVEHTSIMQTMEYLETKGYDITFLSVDKNGRIDLNELISAIREDTFLIAVMMANNEIGNIYPIKEIGEIAKKNNILFHCDAVQALGKIKIDVKDLNIDTLSFSGHKINTPKGIGVLYVKDGFNFIPLIFGHQENNRRGGTENVPYIIGLGKAAELIIKDNYKSIENIKKLRDRMENKIKENIEDVHIYGDLENRIPNTTDIAFKGIKAEEILFVLESYGIYVGMGSACNSKNTELSYVIKAMGINTEESTPIRISLGKHNTKEEIDEFVATLSDTVKMLRRRK